VLVRLLVVASLVAAAPPARAHHRQTPPIVALTAAGDASLPRLPPPSRRTVSFTVDDGVAVVLPFVAGGTTLFSYATGTNGNPSTGESGRFLAWDTDADPLASGAPGRQVVARTPTGLVQLAVDPTGTSANPSQDRYGLFIGFESSGDLAATGNAGARQVFLWGPGAILAQLSRGLGTSENASIGPRARLAAFDSTSDPATGADTGVAQVWLAPAGGMAAPITAGAGDSRRPAVSDQGRFVVFDSRADLAGDGQDTGVPQVFAYDTNAHAFAQVTHDAGGCSDASTLRIGRDWRVTYRCGVDVYFTMLLANTRAHVRTDGGDTTGILPQGDFHFVLVATTADLLHGTGTTTGHQIYMVNLFKRPPDSVPSAVTWF
jgi:hypothetical protein